jgi:Ca2+:H+ antiporter
MGVDYTVPSHRTSWLVPLLAWLALALHFIVGANVVVDLVASGVLIAAVFSAVYHAEVIAHWLGEPFGTLVLAIAATVIEAALIVSMMVGGGPEKAVLARDTVFASVMIMCNGAIGLCLLAGGMRHREQDFQVYGASAALAVLVTMTTLTLALPNFTTRAAQNENTLQLIFAGTVSVILYGSFVFVQTVRHRDYFLPANGGDNDEAHTPPPNNRTAVFSLLLLPVALAAVVGIAKSLTPALESGIDWIGVPKPVVGIVIAAVVLLPEVVASFRAARKNRLQTSMNLALGSVLASIGLTIPSVAAISIVLNKPLSLGLDVKEEVLLLLSLLLCIITLGTGRTTVLQGIVHLVVFAAFLFVAIVP